MNPAKTTRFLIISAFVLLLSGALAQAYVPTAAPYANGVAYGYVSYGAAPVNPTVSGRFYNYDRPARVGGFFGANSAYIHNLRPGIYDGPLHTSLERKYITSANYPRIGGSFNRHMSYNYYNLRPGTFVYGGRGTAYSDVPYTYFGVI